MCFHNSLSKSKNQLEKRFDAAFMVDAFQPVYHAIGFTYPEWPVITAHDPGHIQMFNWGLVPNWTSNRDEALKMRAATLNAKSETVYEKPAFKHSIVHKRCLVLSSGFFEWRDYGKAKYPYLIGVKDQPMFAMAGIFEHWTDPHSGKLWETFSILTTEANDVMGKIHNSKKRMPVILHPDEEKVWLYEGLPKDEIEAMLHPYESEAMTYHTVSKLVNSKNELESNQPKVLEEYVYPELGPLGEEGPRDLFS